MVVFSFLLFQKEFFLFQFSFGRKPSNTNLEDGIPLATRAVMVAHAPGIQITSIP